MANRLLPAGLRAQLAVAIALITMLAVGLSFLAVYRGTSGRLQDRIDEALTTQAAEWEQLRADADLSTLARLDSAARRFIAGGVRWSWRRMLRCEIVEFFAGLPPL